jgi:hypothetical protein
MQKPDTLIRTKLHLPTIRPGLMLRPRLQERILLGLGGPLTLLAAPAGFGKTTLAAACISACGMPAAWLPGSEGAGVTDELFGDYPFTGKLPYTRPRSNDQLPLNINNSANLSGCAAPLFPFGYGLGSAGSQPIEWLNCL